MIEVISKVIQKMAKMSFAKSCKGSFDPASPYGCAVTRVAACTIIEKFFIDAFALLIKKKPSILKDTEALKQIRKKILPNGGKKNGRGCFNCAENSLKLKRLQVS